VPLWVPSGNCTRSICFVYKWVAVEIPSRKNTEERRIDELLARLKKSDKLIVAELSQLGRNMLETLNIVHELTVLRQKKQKAV
jgi:hypothetical protein